MKKLHKVVDEFKDELFSGREEDPNCAMPVARGRGRGTGRGTGRGGT